MSRRTSNTTVTLLLALCSWLRMTSLGAGDLSAGAADPELVAARIVEASGIDRGTCALLDVGDGSLATALASFDGIFVHGWDPDAEAVRVSRSLADAAGLYGKEIVLEKGPPATLPYADNTVDLVLHPAVDTAGLAQLRLAEIERVLRPGGRVLLGRFSGERSALSGTDLSNWLATGSLTLVAVTDEAGVAPWAVYEKIRPKNFGDWSHWEHGPDNNPVADDAAIKAPYMTQWLGQPYYIAMPAITVAAGGRIFIATGHIAHHEREEGWLNTLMARNGHNGTVLWKRKLPDGYLVHRSAFIATADTFYMIDTDGVGCLMLDPATGEERGRLESPLLKGAWKWIAMQDGTLYALVGNRQDPPETTVVRSKLPHWSWGELSKGYYGDRVPWGFGRNLVAYSPTTRKILWRHKEDADIDSRGIAIGDGKIVVYCPDKHILALDLATGEPAWTNADNEVRDLIEEKGQGLSSTPGFRTMTMCLATPDALIFQGQTRQNVIALSTRNGYMLWQKEKTTNNPNAIYVDGTVLLGIGEGGSTLAVEPVSGEVVKDLKFSKRACARLTATTDSLFCRAQPDGLTRYDRELGRALSNGAVRPSCNDGVVGANGLLYMGPWACDCNLSLIGRVALCSAGTFDFAHQATEEAHLERLPNAPSVATQATEAGDWTTYRGDNTRGAYSPVNVAAGIYRTWQHEPTTPYRPTQPTAAAGLVFWGGDDAKVRAFDAVTGTQLWTFFTGGPILQPPTIAEGRAYVGSGDGYIYCLEAATGAQLWRFRAAPVERRIPVYGAFSSTWPVHSNVLVHEGVAHAAAGIIDYDGTYVYALDAVNGSIKWQNGSSGHLDSDLRKGASAQGTLALAAGRLWLAAGNIVSPAPYDLEDGRYRGVGPKNGAPQTNRGQEVGIFRDRYVIVGGRLRFSADQNIVNPGSFVARKIREGDGDAGFGPSVEVSRGRIPPAWDDKDFVVVDGLRGVPKSYDATALEEYLSTGSRRLRPRPRWSGRAIEGADSVSLALTRDAVLVVGSRRFERSLAKKWFVCALDRENGKKLWESGLPQAAFPGALAVDREGRIFVGYENGGFACYCVGESYSEYIAGVIDEARRDPNARGSAVARLRASLADAATPGAHRVIEASLRELGIDVHAEARKNGAVTRWQTIAPFQWDSVRPADYAGVGEPDNVKPGVPVKVGDDELHWLTTLTVDPYGHIDLTKTYGQQSAVALYAHTEFELDQDQDLVILLGTNDGYVAWFNGKEIGRFEGGRGYVRDDDALAVRGKTGHNTLLVKVLQMGNKWDLGVRVTDAKQQPIELQLIGE